MSTVNPKIGHALYIAWKSVCRIPGNIGYRFTVVYAICMHVFIHFLLIYCRFFLPTNLYRNYCLSGIYLFEMLYWHDSQAFCSTDIYFGVVTGISKWRFWRPVYASSDIYRKFIFSNIEKAIKPECWFKILYPLKTLIVLSPPKYHNWPAF